MHVAQPTSPQYPGAMTTVRTKTYSLHFPALTFAAVDPRSPTILRFVQGACNNHGPFRIGGLGLGSCGQTCLAANSRCKKTTRTLRTKHKTLFSKKFWTAAQVRSLIPASLLTTAGEDSATEGDTSDSEADCNDGHATCHSTATKPHDAYRDVTKPASTTTTPPPSTAIPTSTSTVRPTRP
ncbi:hypothetical protein BCR44DRAFT_1246281 [Catenaria anguillulae PL171]|uniref:Uncharacterized protein n=1 Tax=Catenaria anguillulae PL171 TaxID=765915 RepID=A0A1Y2HXK9_9FUNG|nr:hypothetical protein BCR44DRAFT_1246281 [Catenaria anguillulae PL171]